MLRPLCKWRALLTLRLCQEVYWYGEFEIETTETKCADGVEIYSGARRQLFVGAGQREQPAGCSLVLSLVIRLPVEMHVGLCAGAFFELLPKKTQRERLHLHARSPAASPAAPRAARRRRAQCAAASPGPVATILLEHLQEYNPDVSNIVAAYEHYIDLRVVALSHCPREHLVHLQHGLGLVRTSSVGQLREQPWTGDMPDQKKPAAAGEGQTGVSDDTHEYHAHSK